MPHRSLAVCLVLALASVSRADLVCPAPQHDAGQARSGTSLVHRFELINDGTDAVVIGQPRAGCGCLRPTLAKTTLQPGEKTMCQVEVNTVTQAPGDNVWRVLVPYRQPNQQGEVLLQVNAHLIPELTISPATLVLHTASAISHTLKLTERRAAALALRAAVTTSPHIKATTSEPSRDGETWVRTITLDVAEGCPEGRHEHVLHLYSGDPTYPELKVAFTIVKRAPGSVKASPAEIEWRGNEALAAKLLFVSSADNEPVEIERIEPGHPSLAGTFAMGPGPRSTVRIVAGDVPANGVNSSIRVHLKKPAGQVIVVPVRIVP